jgi:hypothetical protein
MTQMLSKKFETTPRNLAFRVTKTDPMRFEKNTVAKTMCPLLVEFNPRMQLKRTT